MGCKSPSPSWPPHRLLRCRCELASQVRGSQGGGAGGGTVEISIGPLLSTFPRLDVVPESVRGTPESISTSKLHFAPRASIVTRRLHCSPGGFLRTDLHLSKPCFVPTRCSSGRCISSPPGTTDPPVRQFGCVHCVIGNQSKYRFTNMHKGDTYGVPSKYWKGGSAVGSHCESERTNPA